MQSFSAKTIVAQATATGEAGIGIIRLSGDKVQDISHKILKRTLKPRYAYYGDFFNAQSVLLDKGVAIFYPKPHSFTGEDVLELQAHGGSTVMNSLLEASLEMGCVLAQAGEFSQRAFLNGKMDLVQAEAVSDLIYASSTQGAQSALRSLSGVFSKQINLLVQQLINLRVLVEASIDFSDEDIDTSEINHIQTQLLAIKQQIQNILINAQAGCILREGIHIAIVGKPNAGKSSLLNALTQHDSAIVTDIAGTTRDTLKETIHINGVAVHIIDTAGLRETNDIVEKEGVRRAYNAIKQADCVILIYDSEQGLDTNLLKEDMQNKPLLIVRNKIDLTQDNNQLLKNEISISAKHHIGLEALKQKLLRVVGVQNLGEDTVLARQRHIEALKQTRTYLQSATQQLNANSTDLLAEDLRLSANALGSITGYFSSDDLLGEIFSTFCIGK